MERNDGRYAIAWLTPSMAARKRNNVPRRRNGSSASPMATLMLSVMSAFAEFERSFLRERQRIALAKQRGAYRGRKKALSSEQVERLQQRVQSGEPKAGLAREFGISRETLYQ